MLLVTSSIPLTIFLAALVLLPILALAHMLQHNYKGRTKLIWVLIILFLPFFGSILYFIMGKRYRRHNPE